MDLHYRFWLSPRWNKFYRDQIASANKLVGKYNDTAIIKALKNPKASGIYSLRAPHLIPIIEQEQENLKKINNEITIDLSRPDAVKFGNTINKHTNIFSKLKDIDNEC